MTAVESLAASEPDGSLTAAVPPLRDDDLSVMLDTSGTTGKPTGVPRTHGAGHAAGAAGSIAARYIRP